MIALATSLAWAGVRLPEIAQCSKPLDELQEGSTRKVLGEWKSVNRLPVEERDAVLLAFEAFG